MPLPQVQSSCFANSIPDLTITAIKPQLSFSLLPAPPNSITTSSGKSRIRIASRRTLFQASPENLASQSDLAVSTGDGDLSSQSVTMTSASDVVRNFYAGINRHDLSSVEDLIAQNCVYEDLVFSTPFVGRKAILEFFQSFIDYISINLQFVIDAISEEDSSAVGVTWHLEWKGKPFPFSKGCSFYRLEIVNGIRQITYARDCVEPAIKPGESALVIIRGVTWLLERFPKLIDRL